MHVRVHCERHTCGLRVHCAAVHMYMCRNSRSLASVGLILRFACQACDRDRYIAISRARDRARSRSRDLARSRDILPLRSAAISRSRRASRSRPGDVPTRRDVGRRVATSTLATCDHMRICAHGHMARPWRHGLRRCAAAMRLQPVPVACNCTGRGRGATCARAVAPVATPRAARVTKRVIYATCRQTAVDWTTSACSCSDLY
jgi:hypothetical protein